MVSQFANPYAEEYERDITIIKWVLTEHQRLLNSRFCICDWQETDDYSIMDHQAGMIAMSLRASFRFTR